MLPGTDKMGGMLSVQMNDAAVRLPGLYEGLPATSPREVTSPGLEDILERGIVRRGQVLTWTDSAGNAEGAPSFPDLTAWECSDSSFHLEDFVPVDAAIVDDAPVIGEAGQRTLLLCGLSFALRFARLVHDLDEPAAVRCIIDADETNATFRFHQAREGEQWNHPDLDRYQQDKLIVADICRPVPGAEDELPSGLSQRRSPGTPRSAWPCRTE